MKGENDPRKYFMIKRPRKNVAYPAEVEPATSWSPDGPASWATKAGKRTFDVQHDQVFTLKVLIITIADDILIFWHFLKQKKKKG